MGFRDMATLVSFWSFFWDRMANLDLIDFKLGLYIKVDVKLLGKTSLKSISQKLGQNGYQLAQNRPDATLARAAPHGHNLAIFHPILTNEYTKMTISSRRIEWIKKLSSISLL